MSDPPEDGLRGALAAGGEVNSENNVCPIPVAVTTASCHSVAQLFLARHSHSPAWIPHIANVEPQTKPSIHKKA
jgi:hypothetical protein